MVRKFGIILTEQVLTVLSQMQAFSMLLEGTSFTLLTPQQEQRSGAS
jgi:hypothetical protein